MDRIEEIYERVQIQHELDDVNIEMAAFTSFIAALEKKDTAHNFCKNPMSFMHFSNISSDIEDPNTFIEEISKELDKIKTIWQPPEKSTRKGFQSLPYINIFENSSTNIDKLKSIILDELDKYYLKYYKKECLYIQEWPTEKNIWGWHVILKRYGHQNLHIHPEGWLSGVVYLKVSQSKEKNEGAIEFSLNGINYSNAKSPKLVYQPKIGDIVFFPSSLHHRTIPFTSDTDRIIISFDLLPEK